MIRVVHAKGIASAATTAINLTNWLRSDVARLVGVRTISRAAQTVNFTGTAVAAHTHNVEAEPAHTHNVEAEPAHIHDAGFSLQADAAGGAAHSHGGGQITPDGGAFTPTVNAVGAFTPTVNAGGGHTPAGTVGIIAGLVHSNLAVQANGLLDTTYTTPGANSVALTGRRQITMGDALASTSIIELRVLYLPECAGVF